MALVSMFLGATALLATPASAAGWGSWGKSHHSHHSRHSRHSGHSGHSHHSLHSDSHVSHLFGHQFGGHFSSRYGKCKHDEPPVRPCPDLGGCDGMITAVDNSSDDHTGKLQFTNTCFGPVQRVSFKVPDAKWGHFYGHYKPSKCIIRGNGIADGAVQEFKVAIPRGIDVDEHPMTCKVDIDVFATDTEFKGNSEFRVKDKCVKSDAACKTCSYKGEDNRAVEVSLPDSWCRGARAQILKDMRWNSALRPLVQLRNKQYEKVLKETAISMCSPDGSVGTRRMLSEPSSTSTSGDMFAPLEGYCDQFSPEGETWTELAFEGVLVSTLNDVVGFGYGLLEELKDDNEITRRRLQEISLEELPASSVPKAFGIIEVNECPALSAIGLSVPAKGSAIIAVVCGVAAHSEF